MLKPHGAIFITSERPLEPQFEPYRIHINPLDMHHVMAFASLYIGDSQTMTSEAAVLGTPAIRCNTFVGRIHYLEEEEHKYGLTYGFRPEQSEEMFKKIEELLSMPNLKEEWQIRRQKMLLEKIDYAQFLTWFVENYPESGKTMKENPEFQYRFK